MPQLLDLSGTSGATFSPDKVYRYDLWRRWNDVEPEYGTPKGGYCGFVMLNPSTADEFANDPTVERCQRRAKDWGYGGIIVANIFALRSTDPAAVRKHPDPIGIANDTYLAELGKRCKMVVVGWGIHGTNNGRWISVRGILQRAGVKPMCLGVTKSGQPRHPLYVGYNIKPEPWWPSL